VYQASNSLPAPAKLIIASRESALAMWQAEHIRDQLRALYPQTEISILGMTTQGDRILDVTLSKIGGKGLFVKELETALEDLCCLVLLSVKMREMLLFLINFRI
jgi:hydroxymethylbilane synthase